jgi:hypothetical protein
MSYVHDKGANVFEKFQSLAILITSFFTTIPLAINCSIIINHSTSSILVEGEYRPSLKNCLIVSGSSSEAPVSTSSKTKSATTFMDFRPRPLTLAKRGAHCAPVFREPVLPDFLFSARAIETRGGASAWEGITHPAMGRRASTFEEKSNNTHK